MISTKHWGNKLNLATTKEIITFIALGWVAIRTIRAPERVGKTVS